MFMFTYFHNPDNYNKIGYPGSLFSKKEQQPENIIELKGTKCSHRHYNKEQIGRCLVGVLASIPFIIFVNAWTLKERKLYRIYQ